MDIDRLVFYDADITDERTRRIKGLVEVELKRLLTQSDDLDRIHDGYHYHVSAKPLDTPLANHESHLAQQLANRIAGTLPGMKR